MDHLTIEASVTETLEIESRLTVNLATLLATGAAPGTPRKVEDILKQFRRTAQRLDKIADSYSSTGSAETNSELLEALEASRDTLLEMEVLFSELVKRRASDDGPIMPEEVQQRLSNLGIEVDRHGAKLYELLDPTTAHGNVSKNLMLNESRIDFNKSLTTITAPMLRMRIERKVRSTWPSERQNNLYAHGYSRLCHEPQRHQTPEYLRKIVGNLRIAIDQRCNNVRCGSRRYEMRITYIFPPWGFQRALQIWYSFSPTKGPEALLSVRRIVPVDAAVFQAIRCGQDARDIQRLFEAGEASPLDVDPEGNTPLHIATKSLQSKLVRFLRQAGGDIHLENFSGLSSFELARSEIIANIHEWDEKTLDHWRSLFDLESLTDLQKSAPGQFETTEDTLIARKEGSSIQHRMSWREPLEEPNGSSSESDAGLDEKPDVSFGGILNMTDASPSDEPGIETVVVEDAASQPYSRSSESANEMINMASKKTIVLFFLVMFVVPCITLPLIILAMIKGPSIFTGPVKRHPQFAGALTVPLLLISIIRLGQWRSWRPNVDIMIDDLHIEITPPRFNNSLLWLSTPSLGIPSSWATMMIGSCCSHWKHNFNVALDNLRAKTISLSRRVRLGVGIGESILDEGKSRVRWRCRCGCSMYDDYVELRLGAAKELEDRLTRVYSMRSPASGTHSSHTSASVPDHGIARSSQQQQQGMTNNNPLLPLHAPKHDPEAQHRTETLTTIPCTPEDRWLLICAREREKPICLHHLNVCTTSSDQQFFRELKQLYHGLRSTWTKVLSSRRVIGVRFVQFELHKHDNVDIRKVPDMPPKGRQLEYVHIPYDLLPPVGPNLMAHLLYHPEEANDEIGITCLKVPKKRKEKLVICPQQGTSTGWGIQFVEGWATFRVWILILLLFGIGGLVFGICWAVLKHDLQGAFGVAAWMMTFVGIVVGTLQAGFD